MTPENGDFVIYTDGPNEKGKHRYHLMKVSGMEGKKVHGHLTKNSHIKSLRTTVEISKKDLVLNLGQDPLPGTVYGQDLNKLYKGRNTHDDFGTLYLFTHMEEDERGQLFDAFTRVYKSLKSQGLDFLVDPSTTIWEILAYNGEKYAGTYSQSRNLEKLPSVASIRPHSMQPSDWRYVIFHELAHHVDFHYLHRADDARKLRADWIRLYKSSIAPELLNKEQCRTFRDNLFDQEEPPTSFATTLDEDETKQFKTLLGYFRSVYSLSPREIDALWEGGYRDDIKEIWPSRIAKKGLAPVISEYATKNVAETFAEALSFYWTKKPLPKNVTKLVEKTLSWVKTQQEG